MVLIRLCKNMSVFFAKRNDQGSSSMTDIGLDYPILDQRDFTK